MTRPTLTLPVTLPRETCEVKALTLWQPWATLMAIGAKRIETRSWPCPAWLIGKPLAIHAAKTADYLCASQDDPARAALEAAGYLGGAYDSEGGWIAGEPLPLGAVVAVVRVTACKPTAEIRRIAQAVPMPEQEWAFGDYSDGRYGWVTELLHRFEEPIPAVGHQLLWNWTLPSGVSGAVARAIERWAAEGRSE